MTKRPEQIVLRPGCADEQPQGRPAVETRQKQGPVDAEEASKGTGAKEEERDELSLSMEEDGVISGLGE